MAKTNFLLGKGERLTEDVVVRSGGGPKAQPYTFQQARARLAPMLDQTVSQIRALPPEACPQGKAVAAVTLNPEFIAKSYFPAELFRQTGLMPVGSKPRRVKPAQRSKGRPPEEALTTELFVMGAKEDFARWQAALGNWAEGTPVARDLMTVEEIAPQTVQEKMKGAIPKKGTTVDIVGVTGSIPVAPTIFEAPEIAKEKRFPGLLFLGCPERPISAISKQSESRRLPKPSRSLRPLVPAPRFGGDDRRLTKRCASSCPPLPSCPNIAIRPSPPRLPRYSEVTSAARSPETLPSFHL